MSSVVARPAYLEPSELGKKEYWDSLYNLEILNNTQDSTDLGTIWFDDCSAEDKSVEFLRSSKLDLDRAKTSFLDLGTGNGHFLLRLREGEELSSDNEQGDGDNVVHSSGFSGQMLGVDYSEKSIEFANRLAESKSLGSGKIGRIDFRTWDLINESPIGIVLDEKNEEGWDVVLDKGTFDAISLSEEKDPQGRRICEAYKERIVPLVKVGGRFFVTSCNWTEEELRGWFEGDAFEYEDCVKYKSFSFGGKKGQSISSLCFRRVS